MESPDVLVETLQSKIWPNVSAEIWKDRVHYGIIWRTKIGSKEYPELVTQKHFETKAQAIAHANVVLGH
jgi:hypothetical protein